MLEYESDTKAGAKKFARIATKKNSRPLKKKQEMNRKPLGTFALTVAIYTLVILTLVKAIATVFANPLLGYANNYDFVRQSSCIGIWQDYANKPNTAANPLAPVNSLIYDGHTSRGVCMKSSDNLFPWITTRLHKRGDKVDFREISLWKVTFVFAFFFILLSKTTDPRYKLAIAFAFFLIFGDLVNLLYANTLYLEFSVVAGLFFSLFSTTLLMSARSKDTSLIVATIISLCWLGFSKQQYMPLATLLGTACSAIVFFKYSDRRLALIFLLLAAATPLAYSAMNNSDHMQGVNFANKTDTFLGAVLPEATDKEKALSKLGLPTECMGGIGKNWYMPDVIQHHPCPEVEHVSRAKLIGIFISDPATLLEPMHKALIRIRPFYPDHIGHMTDPSDGSSQRYLLLKRSSLSTALAALPADYMLSITLASILLGLAAMISIGASLRSRTSPPSFAWMILLGGLFSFYALFSSVFGDGYVDMQKHAVGFLVGLAFQLTGVTFLSVTWLIDRRPIRRTAVQ